MSVRVVIPRHLSPHVGHRSEVAVEADNLLATLETLSRDYGLGDVFLNPEGDLQDFIRVIVEQQFVTSKRSADLRQVPVAGRTVEITTAFAGG